MMVGPKVSYVPTEDARPIHVTAHDLVLRLTVMEAQALQVKLAARLQTINLVVPCSEGGSDD